MKLSDMPAQEATARLLAGQKNIGRMESEIRSLVRTVMWCAKKLAKPNLSCNETYKNWIDFTFFGTWTCWTVQGHLHDKGKIRVYCTATRGNHEGRADAFEDSDYCTTFAADLIEKVYLDLPFFVRGMLEKLPAIDSELEYLVSASRVSFGNQPDAWAVAMP